MPLAAVVVRHLALHASRVSIAYIVAVAGLGGGGEADEGENRTDDDGVAHGKVSCCVSWSRSIGGDAADLA